MQWVANFWAWKFCALVFPLILATSQWYLLKLGGYWSHLQHIEFSENCNLIQVYDKTSSNWISFCWLFMSFRSVKAKTYYCECQAKIFLVLEFVILPFEIFCPWRRGREGGGWHLRAAERRFFLKSAEGRRINTCRSRRFIKNVCRSSQINFPMPQKIFKKHQNFKFL